MCRLQILNPNCNNLQILYPNCNSCSEIFAWNWQTKPSFCDVLWVGLNSPTLRCNFCLEGKRAVEITAKPCQKRKLRNSRGSAKRIFRLFWVFLQIAMRERERREEPRPLPFSPSPSSRGGQFSIFPMVLRWVIKIEYSYRVIEIPILHIFRLFDYKDYLQFSNHLSCPTDCRT